MSSIGAGLVIKAAPNRALRVGVVGAGVMGSNHARVLAGLPDVTISLTFTGSANQLTASAIRQLSSPSALTSSPKRDFVMFYPRFCVSQPTPFGQPDRVDMAIDFVGFRRRRF